MRPIRHPKCLSVSLKSSFFGYIIFGVLSDVDI